MLIDGDRMTSSWPSRNIKQVTDIGTAQGRVQKYFVDGTAADLRRQFDIDDARRRRRPAERYYVIDGAEAEADSRRRSRGWSCGSTGRRCCSKR